MSGTPMSQDERQEISALRYKKKIGTITSTESDRLTELQDTFQCDD